MTDKRDLELINGMNASVARLYEALGLKPGEGGKFGPYVSGYEAAMRDVQAMIASQKPIAKAIRGTK